MIIYDVDDDNNQDDKLFFASSIHINTMKILVCIKLSLFLWIVFSVMIIVVIEGDQMILTIIVQIKLMIKKMRYLMRY